MSKPLGLATLSLLAFAASAFLALRKPLHFDSAWTDATRVAFEHATGLDIAVRGPIDVSVFPRPMLVAHDVAISDAGGAMSLQAPVVRGLFSLAALLVGRTTFDKLEFDDMSGSIDAEAATGALARSGPSARRTGDAEPDLPGTLALNAGSVQVRSVHPGLSGFLTDLHLLVDGVGGGAGAVSGGAAWHGEHVELSARIDSVAQLWQGKPTAGSLKLRSDVGSASAIGTFTGPHPGAFAGSVTVSSPSLSTLLRMAGLPPGVMDGIGHFGFSGTAEPTQDGVAFEDAHLAVNQDNLEGSVALQLQDGRVDLLGTLAAEQLDIEPFLAVLPSVRTPTGEWNTEPIPFDAANLHDTDLRLSVGRLVYDTLHADEVALSLLCRQGRMELSLGEARTYGGLLKARLFAANGPGRLKAEVSWSQVDVATVSKVLPQVFGKASGTSSGTVALEGVGHTFKAIVHDLNGKGQASWRQMRVQSLPALSALLQPGAEPLPIPMSFDLASLDFSIADGLLALGNAAVSTADRRVHLSGQTFLPDGTFLLAATPVPADGTDEADTPAMPARRVAGVWGKSVRAVKTAADEPQATATATGHAQGVVP